MLKDGRISVDQIVENEMTSVLMDGYAKFCVISQYVKSLVKMWAEIFGFGHAPDMVRNFNFPSQHS